MSHAAELLEEATFFERLAMRAALRTESDDWHDGARYARVETLRSVVRRLRSKAAQWDDAADLSEWYSGLGARELCARGRAAGLSNTERADGAPALHAA